MVATGASETATTIDDDLPSLVALIEAPPTATALTNPDADTVATLVLLDDQLMLRPPSDSPMESFGVAES